MLRDYLWSSPRRIARWILLQIACSGLEGDQVEFLRRFEHRMSPWHAYHGQVSLRELREEARINAIQPWRINLLL